MAKDKKIIYFEVPVELDRITYQKLIKMGKELIVKDEDELVNYAANYILRKSIEKMRKSCTR